MKNLKSYKTLKLDPLEQEFESIILSLRWNSKYIHVEHFWAGKLKIQVASITWFCCRAI